MALSLPRTPRSLRIAAALAAALTASAFGPETADASVQLMQSRSNVAGASLGGLTSNGGVVAMELNYRQSTSGSWGDVDANAGAYLTQRFNTVGGPPVASFLTFCVDLTRVDGGINSADVGVIAANPGAGNGSPSIRNITAAG